MGAVLGTLNIRLLSLPNQTSASFRSFCRLNERQSKTAQHNGGLWAIKLVKHQYWRQPLVRVCASLPLLLCHFSLGLHRRRLCTTKSAQGRRPNPPWHYMDSAGAVLTIHSGNNTSQPQQSAGLFGASTTATQPQTGSLFGGQNQTSQPQTGSLFGNQAKPATTGATGGGLFGASTAQSSQPQSGGLFGGALGGNTQTQSQSTTQSGGLFGNQAKPSLL